jgi:hypothetical protein
MVDKWLVLVISQFVSGITGFVWGIITGGILFLYIGGFFFSLGVFAATRWGYDKWKAKQKQKQKKQQRRRG